MYDADSLRHDLNAGPIDDVAKAERSFALLHVIGKHADEINARRFGDLFYHLQANAIAGVFLHVARLHDRPDKTYPTLCLRYVLANLRASAEVLEILDKWNTVEDLRRLGMPEARLEIVQSGPVPDATREIVTYFEQILDDEGVKDTLEKVKAFRDKRIAHNERVVAALPTPTDAAVRNLIQVGKSLITVLGSAYLNTGFGQAGDYWLTADAERPSLELVRLLEDARVIPPRRDRPIHPTVPGP